MRYVALADPTLNQNPFLKGSFRVHIAPPSTIPTVVRVRYTDTSELVWRERSVTEAVTGVSSGLVERRESPVKLPGVQRDTQAKREALERLQKHQRATTQITFQLPDEFIDVAIGDVLAITHTKIAALGTAVLFRVIERPSMQRAGRVRVRCALYSADDYDDTEDSVTYGGFTQFGGTTLPEWTDVQNAAGLRPENFALRGERVHNFDFEIDQDGWTPRVGVTEYSYGDSEVDTITFDETDAHTGDQALVIEWDTNYAGNDPGVLNTRKVQVCPENGFQLAAFVKAEGAPPSACQPCLLVAKYESDDTLVEEVQLYATEDSTVPGQAWVDNVWRHLNFIGGCGTVDDDDVAYIRVGMAVNFQNSPSAGDQFRFDGVELGIIEDPPNVPGIAINPDFAMGSYAWNLGKSSTGIAKMETRNGASYGNEPHYGFLSGHAATVDSVIASSNFKEYPAAEGDRFSVGGIVRCQSRSGSTDTNGGMGWRLAFLDSAGATISTLDAEHALNGPTAGDFNVWVPVQAVGAAPANTEMVRLEWYSRNDQDGNYAWSSQSWVAGTVDKLGIAASGIAEAPVPTSQVAQNAVAQLKVSSEIQTVTTSYQTYTDVFQADTTGADSTACKLALIIYVGDGTKTATLQVLVEKSTDGGSVWTTENSVVTAIMPQNWTPFPIEIDPDVDESDIRYRIRVKRNTGSDQTLEIRAHWVLNKA